MANRMGLFEMQKQVLYRNLSENDQTLSWFIVATVVMITGLDDSSPIKAFTDFNTDALNLSLLWDS